MTSLTYALHRSSADGEIIVLNISMRGAGFLNMVSIELTGSLINSQVLTCLYYFMLGMLTSAALRTLHEKRQRIYSLPSVLVRHFISNLKVANVSPITAPHLEC